MRVLLTCDTRIFFSSNRSPMLLASAINKLLMTHRFSIFTLASLLLLVWSALRPKSVPSMRQKLLRSVRQPALAPHSPLPPSRLLSV